MLYSTNTWLAYMIAEKFYRGIHWIYCSEHFSRHPDPLFAAPPSSTPHAIYKQLRDDVDGSDHHSAKIEQNRLGLLKGAAARLKDGTITQAQHDSIVAIVGKAQLNWFRPILYVMPHDRVGHLVQDVPVTAAANPLWSEAIIAELPRTCFDALELT